MEWISFTAGINQYRDSFPGKNGIDMKLRLELITIHTADPVRGRALNDAAVREGNRRMKEMVANMPPHLKHPTQQQGAR
jgi:hypothetical protein